MASYSPGYGRQRPDESSTSLSHRFRLVLASFLQHDGLAFAGVLPEERIQQAFDEEDVHAIRDSSLLTGYLFLPTNRFFLFLGRPRRCGRRRLPISVSSLLRKASLASGLPLRVFVRMRSRSATSCGLMSSDW